MGASQGEDTLLNPYSVEAYDCNVHDKSTPCKSLNSNKANTPILESLKLLGASDAASYLRGGLVVAGKSNLIDLDISGSLLSRLQKLNEIGYGLWPPGMFLFNGALISINSKFEIGFLQLLSASMVWALALATITCLLSKRIHMIYSFMIILAMHAYPLFNTYMYQYGVQFSETYSSAFMVIGFAGLYHMVYTKKLNAIYILFGLSLSLAALFRAQLYLVLIGISFILLMYAFLNSKNALIRRDNLFLFLIGAYVPIIVYIVFNHGALFRADYNFWNPFLKEPSSLLVGGGILTACQVDLNSCQTIRELIFNGTINGSIAKIAVLKAFLMHPFDFINLKFPFLASYWLEADSGKYYYQNPGKFYYQNSSKFFYQNIFIFVIALSTLFYLIFNREWVHLFFVLAIFGLFLGPPFLLHFEARYLYQLKIYIVFLPIWIFLAISKKTYI